MDSTLISVGLPVALGVIMLGLGLGLRLDDFRRIFVYPKVAFVALSCQILLLPALCFGLVVVLDLKPELAVGMMLLAASPGGPTANLYSHLFGGNVALNITLTAVNSTLSVVTLPLVVNLSLAYFLGDAGSVGLQYDKVLQVLVIVLGPVCLGMVVRSRVPALATSLTRPVKVLSVIVLLAVIAGAIVQQRNNIADYFVAVGVVALVFNLMSLSVGYGAPRLVGVGKPDAIAAGMEMGIHNATLAITIALSPALLNNAEMAIPAAVYGIFQLFTAVGFGYLIMPRKTGVAPAAAGPADRDGGVKPS